MVRQIIDAATRFETEGLDHETAFDLACEKYAGKAPATYGLARKIWDRMR